MVRKPLNVVLIACWGIGYAMLRTLIEEPRVKIRQVFTRSPCHRDPWKGMIMLEAQRIGLPVASFEKMTTETLCRQLIEIKPDLILVHAYPKKIPPKVFRCSKLGTVNFHPALLPNHRGKDPTSNVLAQGEAYSGLTAHYVDNDYDTGDIICQKKIPIFRQDTRDAVITRLKNIVPDLIQETLNNLSNPHFIPRKQNRNGHESKKL